MATLSATSEWLVKKRSEEIGNAILVAPGWTNLQDLRLFSMGLELSKELAKPGSPDKPSEKLSKQFADHEKTLSAGAKLEVKQEGSYWTIVDTDKTYLILKEYQTLNVYLPAAFIATGTLDQKEGNILKADKNKRPRLIAVLGLDCTIYGLALRLLPFINAVPATTPGWPVTEMDLTKALYSYNYTSEMSFYLPDWYVGLHVTLPVEVDVANKHLIVDLDAIKKLAEQYPLPDGSMPALIAPTTNARLLEIEDPDKLRTRVNTDLTTKTTVEPIAQDLRNRLLANPYEVVFYAIELMRQIEHNEGRKSQLPELAAEMIKKLESASNIFLKQIAWSTAGNAVLRRLWVILSDGTAVGSPERNSADKVADALELVAAVKNGVGGWKGLYEYGPKVTPREPPLTKVQIANQKAARFISMGRIVPVGRDSYTKDREGGIQYIYNGPAFAGTLAPRDWIARHIDRLSRPLGPSLSSGPEKKYLPITKQKVNERLKIIQAISDNEGKLDACRMLDKGIISTGIMQWSAHRAEELAPVLARFKKVAPDDYDLFYGMHRLDVQLTNIADNPFAQEAEADKYFPSKVELHSMPPEAKNDILEFIEHDECDRLTFFGGKKTSEKKNKKGKVTQRTFDFAPDWAARISLAALCSSSYRDVQIDMAVWRFTRLELQKGLGDTVFIEEDSETGKKQYYLTELFTSQFGAALVIDQHVNRPNDVSGDIKKAINRTNTAIELDRVKRGEAAKDPIPINDEWLRRLTLNYATLRTIAHATLNLECDVTDKDWRNLRIFRLHDGKNPVYSKPPDDILLTGKGTFAGW